MNLLHAGTGAAAHLDVRRLAYRLTQLGHDHRTQGDEIGAGFFANREGIGTQLPDQPPSLLPRGLGAGLFAEEVEQSLAVGSDASRLEDLFVAGGFPGVDRHSDRRAPANGDENGTDLRGHERGPRGSCSEGDDSAARRGAASFLL